MGVPTVFFCLSISLFHYQKLTKQYNAFLDFKSTPTPRLKTPCGALVDPKTLPGLVQTMKKLAEDYEHDRMEYETKNDNVSSGKPVSDRVRQSKLDHILTSKMCLA